MNFKGQQFEDFITLYEMFIRWFHEFSVTTNLRIFRETEFFCLFLYTTGYVNNKTNFCTKKSYIRSYKSYKIGETM